MITKQSLLGFAAGVLFVIALEGAGFFLFMNSFGADEELDKVALDVPPVPAEVSLADIKFTFMDMQGGNHTSSELQGQVVVLNLWATWCPPCKAEMPSLDALWKKYRGKAGVYCLSEEPVEAVRANPLLAGLSMPVYVFTSPLPTALDTRGLPTTYIFDRTGRLRFTHTGMAQWDAPEVSSFLDNL